MATKKKGFISRMIEGPERSESYARSTLPGNRWELGWDVLKTNFGKIVGLNLLMLVFFIPLFLVFGYHFLLVTAGAGNGAFSQNVGIGYPALPSSPGSIEGIKWNAAVMSYPLIPVAGAIAAVGLSGGMYIMRNMVWAEGVIVGKDFWSGVRKNYGIVFLSTLAYTVLLTIFLISNASANLMNATTGGKWYITAMQIVSYVFIAFISIMYLFTLTFGVTYKLKFRNLIRNSFIMSLALIPLNLFFALFSLVFFLIIMIGGFFASLGIMAFIFLGLSCAALIWTDYSQWAFDKFINDNVPGAVKNKGIYSKTEETESDFSYERSTLGKRPVKPITDYDVEIFEIPETFSRADLQKLEESKQAMRKDSDEYVNNVLNGIVDNNLSEGAENNADNGENNDSGTDKVNDSNDIVENDGNVGDREVGEVSEVKEDDGVGNIDSTTEKPLKKHKTNK